MRFKSIFAHIIFLQTIALVTVAIFMPSALYWFMRSAASDLHGLAMLDQADVLSNHLALREDGTLVMELPASLQDLYSEAYGRYAYAVINEKGQVLFSSLQDHSPVFSRSARSPETAFLTARRVTRQSLGLTSQWRLPADRSGCRSGKIWRTEMS